MTERTKGKTEPRSPFTFKNEPGFRPCAVKLSTILADKKELIPHKLDDSGYPEPFWGRTSTTEDGPLCGRAFPVPSFRN